MYRRDVGSVHFFRLPNMAGVELVYGDRVVNDFRRHVHNSLCIGIVDEGTRIVRMDGKSTGIPENCLFVINPGASHRCNSLDKEGHSYRIISVDSAVVTATASQISGRIQPLPHFADISVADKELRDKVKQFFLLAPQSGSRPARDSVFVSLLCQLIMRYGDKPITPLRAGSERAAIRRVCEFINVNYAETLSLEQLARIAYLSPFHFQRVFVRQVGTSPHDYLIHCRISRARDLLSKGHSIVRVALDVGFHDQSHFTRCFSRVVGIPPGRFLSLHKVTPKSST
jgi:AraC-like DNA-binding protein